MRKMRPTRPHRRRHRRLRHRRCLVFNLNNIQNMCIIKQLACARACFNCVALESSPISILNIATYTTHTHTHTPLSLWPSLHMCACSPKNALIRAGMSKLVVELRCPCACERAFEIFSNCKSFPHIWVVVVVAAAAAAAVRIPHTL